LKNSNVACCRDLLRRRFFSVRFIKRSGDGGPSETDGKSDRQCTQNRTWLFCIICLLVPCSGLASAQAKSINAVLLNLDLTNIKEELLFAVKQRREGKPF
jgi:hypothetical protein